MVTIERSFEIPFMGGEEIRVNKTTRAETDEGIDPEEEGEDDEDPGEGSRIIDEAHSEPHSESHNAHHNI
jgi:hypothetical protein